MDHLHHHQHHESAHHEYYHRQHHNIHGHMHPGMHEHALLNRMASDVDIDTRRQDMSSAGDVKGLVDTHPGMALSEAIDGSKPNVSAGVSLFANASNGLVGEHQRELAAYWQRTITDIETRDHDFKSHALPLARIKKVMKADEDVKMISAEAPILFAKGCEIFITELTMRAWVHAHDSKRRTLARSDVANAISRSDMFDFLIDIVPREEFVAGATGADGVDATPVAGAAGGFIGMSLAHAGLQQQQQQHHYGPQHVQPMLPHHVDRSDDEADREADDEEEQEDDEEEGKGDGHHHAYYPHHEDVHPSNTNGHYQPQHLQQQEQQQHQQHRHGHQLGHDRHPPPHPPGQMYDHTNRFSLSSLSSGAITGVPSQQQQQHLHHQHHQQHQPSYMDHLSYGQIYGGHNANGSHPGPPSSPPLPPPPAPHHHHATGGGGGGYGNHYGNPYTTHGSGLPGILPGMLPQHQTHLRKEEREWKDAGDVSVDGGAAVHHGGYGPR